MWLFCSICVSVTNSSVSHNFCIVYWDRSFVQHEWSKTDWSVHRFLFASATPSGYASFYEKESLEAVLWKCRPLDTPIRRGGWWSFTPDELSEMVVLYVDMLRSWSHLRYIGNFHCSCVVLEYCAINLRHVYCWYCHVCLYFSYCLHERYDFAQWCGESDIFGFGRWQGDLRLQLGCPYDGAFDKFHVVPCSRSGRVGIFLAGYLVPIATEVGVDSTFEGLAVTGCHDDAFVSRCDKVSHDMLDCLCVSFARIFGEASALVDGECDLGSRRLLKEVELANDRSVVKLLVEGVAIFIFHKDDRW